MKKAFVLLLSVLLVIAMSFTFIGCDMFSMGGNNGNGTNEDKQKQEEQAKKEAEKRNKQALLNEYETLIAELKEAIADAESADDYIKAFLTVLQKLPKETLTDTVGLVAGDANAALVDEYFDQVMTILGYAEKFLPEMDRILELLKHPIAGLVVKYDEATNTYSGFGYSFQISEDELGNEIYAATDNKGNKYIITFDMEKKAFYGTAGKIASEGYDYKIQAKFHGEDLYAQLLDNKKEQLFQLFIDVDALEGTISLSEASEFAYDIIASIPTGFATDGTVYTFNEDMLKDLREFIAS